MTTPLGLAERVTTLEYAVFEQIPATMAAMRHGTAHLYAQTVANGEAIAGLKVDMAALQAAISLQGDSLRTELGAATTGLRFDMTGLRESMDMRFQKVDSQFNGLRADMDQRFEAVDQRFDAVDQRFDAVDQRFETVDQRFETVDQRFDGLDTQLRELRADMDAKLDTILGELRKPTD